MPSRSTLPPDVATPSWIPAGPTGPPRPRHRSVSIGRPPAGPRELEAQARERDLIARLRRGEEGAYATLTSTYGPRMFAVARSYLPTHQDAEDVLQTALMLVFRNIRHFKETSKLSTWMHRIVVNAALMRIRTRTRHPEERLHTAAFEKGSIPEPVALARSTVEGALMHRETREHLLEAVDLLPAPLRAVVRLRDVHGVSLADTALLLKLTPTAVKAAIQRGRGALRALVALQA